MPPEISVHFLPGDTSSRQVQGGTAVIVDVLRASTTIVTALHEGAEAVRPCLSVEQARDHREHDQRVLLGGERGGVRIDGFDLSNSPTDYNASAVGGRTIAFTTTNGTRALLNSLQAEQILIGSFVNASMTARYLAETDRPVHIVCAGTDGEITGEDVLFAGCLTERILQAGAPDIPLNDSATIARGWWRDVSGDRSLADALRQTRGGRNLAALSYDRDIELCAELDRRPVLAIYCPEEEQIRLDAGSSV